jgi:hypothetical protein
VRLNVWVPDVLAQRVREELPGLNVSATLRAALEAQIECRHRFCRCVACGAEVDLRAERSGALERFYRELVAELAPLVRSCGTAEGAGRLLAKVGHANGLRAAQAPLVRPTRKNRKDAADRSWSSRSTG